MPTQDYEIIGKERYQHVTAPTYEDICQMRQDLGVKSESFLALKEESDPFYAGGGARLEDAKWFKALWKRFGYMSGVHLRRMHYQIVSQDPPVMRRERNSGKNRGVDLPYINNDECWQELTKASLAARYLWSVLPEDEREVYAVNPEWFEDRRNGEAIGEIDKTKRAAGLDVLSNSSFSGIEIDVSDELCPPEYSLDIRSPQPYHLEIWCEKSTQDDILKPLAGKYRMVLRHGMGELSVTIALEALKRFKEVDKPVRVFYLSDFDPNGWDMPKSMSRKMQFFNQTCQDFGLKDIKLFHTLLTREQCIQYDLPETPVKDGNNRKDEWFARWGRQATELDALEALHPGELRRLLVREIERYYDPSLERRLVAYEMQTRQRCNAVQETIYEIHASALSDLEEKRNTAISQIEAIIEQYQAEQDRVFEEIQKSLCAHAPSLSEENVPLAREANENTTALFDSSRNFLEQNAYYQEHRGTPIEYYLSRGRKSKVE